MVGKKLMLFGGVQMSSMAVIACVCVGDWTLLESSPDLYLLISVS